MKPINLSKKIDGKWITFVKLELTKFGNWQVSFAPAFKAELDKGEWLNLSLFEQTEDDANITKHSKQEAFVPNQTKVAAHQPQDDNSSIPF